MYSHLIVSILIGFVVTHIPNGSKVSGAGEPPKATPQQNDLSKSFYREELWENLWFAKVADGKHWEDVRDRLLNRRARPGVPKKVQMIPVMMGCNYGLLINWFLSLAFAVIEECNALSVHGHGTTSTCWNRLADCLRKGSYTMLELMRALTYVRHHVKDPTDLQLFYGTVSKIYDFLTRRSVVEVCAKESTYIESLNDLIRSSHDFLIDKCIPEYERIVLQEVENEREAREPTTYSYEYYLGRMDSYIEYVTVQLTEFGFCFDHVTDQPDFKPDNANLQTE